VASNHKISTKHCKKGYMRGLGLEPVGDGISHQMYRLHGPYLAAAEAKLPRNLADTSSVEVKIAEAKLKMGKSASYQLMYETLTMGRRILSILEHLHNHELVLVDFRIHDFAFPAGGSSSIDRILLSNLLNIRPAGFAKTIPQETDYSGIHQTPWEYDVDPGSEYAVGYRDDLYNLIELMNYVLSFKKYKECDLSWDLIGQIVGETCNAGLDRKFVNSRNNCELFRLSQNMRV